MELLEVAGLTELFAESWCLIEYRMRGRLSSGCACEDAAEEAPRHAFIRHDVATHSVAALSSRLLAAIDAITALDQVLYRAAVVRFLRDVRGVESRAGVRILCEARLELLRRTTRYIPGLWTSSETKFTQYAASRVSCAATGCSYSSHAFLHPHRSALPRTRSHTAPRPPKL